MVNIEIVFKVPNIPFVNGLGSGLGSHLSRNKMFRLRFHRQSHPNHNTLSTGQQRQSSSNSGSSSSNRTELLHHNRHGQEEQRHPQQQHLNHYHRLFSSVHWTQVT